MEAAPQSSATSSGGQQGGAWQCLCPRGDWRANWERAWANDCPFWIQHVADAAATLLRHSYELSGGIGCRFAGYRNQADGQELTEEDVTSQSVVVFDWKHGALQRPYQAEVPYGQLAAAFAIHCQAVRPCTCKAGMLIEVPPHMA